MEMAAFAGSESVVTGLTEMADLPPGRLDRDSSGSQASACRFTTYPGLLLDATKQPSQPRHGYDLLLLLFAQDNAHIPTKGIWSPSMCWGDVLLMAGFWGDH